MPRRAAGGGAPCLLASHRFAWCTRRPRVPAVRLTGAAPVLVLAGLGPLWVPDLAGSAAPRTRIRGRSRSRDRCRLDQGRPDQGRPESGMGRGGTRERAGADTRVGAGGGTGDGAGAGAQGRGRGGREGPRAPSASGWPVGSLVTCALPSSGCPRGKVQKAGDEPGKPICHFPADAYRPASGATGTLAHAVAGRASRVPRVTQATPVPLGAWSSSGPGPDGAG